MAALARALRYLYGTWAFLLVAAKAITSKSVNPPCIRVRDQSRPLINFLGGEFLVEEDKVRLSNHGLTRLKRFVPTFTDKLCN
jgi:hypothetical protein